MTGTSLHLHQVQARPRELTSKGRELNQVTNRSRDKVERVELSVTSGKSNFTSPRS